MIDEFGNDCPYDFKNIMFKRCWTDGIDMGGEIILQGYFAHENFFSEGIDVANVAWCYTFNFVENFDNDYSNVWDASLNSAISRAGILPDSEPCANNVIKQNWVTQILDDASNAALSLNNIVFLNSPDEGLGPAIANNDTTAKIEMCHGNTFAEFNFDMTFAKNCYYNSFGNNCYSNSFGNNSDKNDMKYDFVSEVRFDDGVSYVNLKPSFVASKSQYICNIHILRGVHGATKIKNDTGYYNWSNTNRRLDVVIDIFSQDYELCVGMTKAGKLKMWANEPTDIQEMTIEEVENKFA